MDKMSVIFEIRFDSPPKVFDQSRFPPAKVPFWKDYFWQKCKFKNGRIESI